MFNRFLISLLLLCSVNFLPAQETTTADAAIIYPFEGQVRYHLTYSKTAPVDAELPDTMDFYIRGGSWAVEWHGGASKEIMQRMIWNADDSLFLLVRPQEKTVYQMDLAFEGPVAKVTPTKSEITLLEHPCQEYKITTGDHAYRIWASDSLQVQTVSDSFPRPAPPFLAGGLNRLPLKIENSGPSGQVTSEAVQIIPGSADPGKFSYPENYSMKTFDFFSPHPWMREH